MLLYATIRWSYVAMSGFTLLLLASALFSAIVAIRSIRNERFRDTALVALLDHKPGVHLTIWSAILAGIFFLICVVERLLLLSHSHQNFLRPLVFSQFCLVPLILLLAGYESLRWRLTTPRATRRQTRGGDYDLILIFIFLLLLVSFLIPVLPIPWRS